MKSREYWQKRNIQALAAVEREEEKTKARLLKFYRSEAVRLKKEIAAFYTKYGESGVIEFRRLMEQLEPWEREQLFRDFSSFSSKYKVEHLEKIRNNIYKLNRLEGLQASVTLHTAEIGETEIEAVTEHLEKVGLISWEAVSDTLGHGVDKEISRRFVGTEWSNGADFSTRIWGNTERLAQVLNTDIAQGFARGDQYRKLTKQLTDRFENVTTRNAYRLIYTEGTYVYNETAATGFEEDGGYTRYQISTAEDAKVCSVCDSLKGTSFSFKDRVPGVNFPPLHPFCRCSFFVEIEE